MLTELTCVFPAPSRCPDTTVARELFSHGDRWVATATSLVVP